MGGLACALILFVSDAWGVDLLVTNVRVFVGTGAEAIEGATVAVTGNRIEAISKGDINAPGARVIDAAGKTLMPGLINGHFHLFFDFQGERYFPSSDAEAEAYMDGKLREKLAAHLESGFTSLVSPIDFWPYIVRARDMVRSGSWSGPRLFVAGGALTSPGGHRICNAVTGEAKQWCNEHISIPVANAEQAREGVRFYAEGGADFIAFEDDSESPVDSEVISAIVEEAHHRDLRVFAHSVQAQNVNALHDAGVDGFLHAPDGVRPDDSPGFEFDGRKVPLAITLAYLEEPISSGEASDDQVQKYQAKRGYALEMFEAGAVPVFASDMPGIAPQQIVPIVVRSLTGLGLSNAEILKAATHDAAELLLGQSELGTVLPGQIADLIIVDGDPVHDLVALTRVEVVIKDGQIVVDKLSSKVESTQAN